MKELINIQSELKAAKTRWNEFSHYHFRSAEDILESVKPLLKSNNCYLTISDEVVVIGQRYYVKAVATLKSAEESISVTAYAREEEAKKGYDCAQITGAASSYARKYALNGLLCIDDSRDPDSDDNTGKEQPKERTKPAADEKKSKTDLEQAFEALERCKDNVSVDEVMKAFKNLWSNQKFKDAISKRREELK